MIFLVCLSVCFVLVSVVKTVSNSTWKMARRAKQLVNTDLEIQVCNFLSSSKDTREEMKRGVNNRNEMETETNFMKIKKRRVRR